MNSIWANKFGMDIILSHNKQITIQNHCYYIAAQAKDLHCQIAFEVIHSDKHNSFKRNNKLNAFSWNFPQQNFGKKKNSMNKLNPIDFERIFHQRIFPNISFENAFHFFFRLLLRWVLEFVYYIVLFIIIICYLEMVWRLI